MDAEKRLEELEMETENDRNSKTPLCKEIKICFSCLFSHSLSFILSVDFSQLFSFSISACLNIDIK